MSNIDLSRLETAETRAAAAVAELLQLIANARWNQETAGVIWRGLYIATDRESQSKLDQADSAAQRGVRKENSVWKCFDPAAGELLFRPTTNAEMSEIATRAYQYVADCFSREGALVEAAFSGTFTDDLLLQGWPSRDITPEADR
jgi:hypothetical protein